MFIDNKKVVKGTHITKDNMKKILITINKTSQLDAYIGTGFMRNIEIDKLNDDVKSYIPECIDVAGTHCKCVAKIEKSKDIEWLLELFSFYCIDEMVIDLSSDNYKKYFDKTTKILHTYDDRLIVKLNQ
jgi:hypothetical protein